MKALVCALNTKYVHSSLAPWCLLAGVREYGNGAECEIYEGTVNESEDMLFSELIKKDFDLIGFSTYIWNKKTVLALAKRIKETRNVAVALGGPEVSYNQFEILSEYPYVDYVLSGEGEEPFGRLCSGEDISFIPGISYRKDGKIIEKPPHVSEKAPLSPYCHEYFDRLDGRISYIETSRGCPFNCAFCLSGRCGGVRFFDIDRAKKEILALARSGTKTVKFIDRSFNADKKRAKELLSFIISSYGDKIPKGVCFHFEIEGALLDDETLDILSRAPRGAIQVEIGLQSFNKTTLGAINRRKDTDGLVRNIRKIIALDNIHVHIDLIAGLPYEDVLSFEDSFNKALSLEPHMLQLGFLKLLHGSELREKSDYVFEFNDEPPYEVISTPHMSRDDLDLLHRVEDVFEKMYNSSRFRHTCKYLHSLYASPFKMYREFSYYLHRYKTGNSLDCFTFDIFSYFSSLDFVNKDVLRDKLAYDRLSVNREGSLPEFLKIHTPLIKEYLNYLEKDPMTKRKKGVKRAATVLPTENRLMYVDYDMADPVHRAYNVKKSDINFK